MKTGIKTYFKCAHCDTVKDATIYPNMSDYVYKRIYHGVYYFCGWNCMCAWDREKAEEKRRNIEKRNLEQRTKMIAKKHKRSAKVRTKALEMYLTDKTLEEIASELNKTTITIRRYLRESGYKWNWTTRRYEKVRD